MLTVCVICLYLLSLYVYISIYLLLVVQQLAIVSGDEKELQRGDDLILPIQVNHGECIMD